MFHSVLFYLIAVLNIFSFERKRWFMRSGKDIWALPPKNSSTSDLNAHPPVSWVFAIFSHKTKLKLIG
jgi:hypothetical protein